MKRSILVVLFCCLFVSLAFVQKDDDPLDRLVAALQKWTELNPQEKVYLHMDKPYYGLGDTIWFKGYVTIGNRHQLSALSGALYVELLTEKDSVLKRLKLPVTAGMAMGDFTLDDAFKEGNYRIRAYTQWMRNAGEDYFFDRTFTVSNPTSSNVIAKANYQYRLVEKKSLLVAELNYKDEAGLVLSDKEVQYEIFVNKKRVWGKRGKTDEQGNLSFIIPNDKQADLRGAYIRAVIEAGPKVQVSRDFPITAGLVQSDVQFFPESGNLINGITSRVAVKAVGIDGLGLKVKGTIVDNAQKEVATFETLHAGMGVFTLHSELGKTYTARLVFSDGTLKELPLPAAQEDGYVLGIYQPNSDSVLVRISTSAKTIAAANGAALIVNFIAQSGGETVAASPVKINRQITSFWLQKSAFPSGIAQFNIFDAAGQPLNERVAFIKSRDRMDLKISTTKPIYGSKERVEVNLEARDSGGKYTSGNFSVSVVDESKVPVNKNQESTIFSNLLLTSDLKGYVEQPNYYFANETVEAEKALDNLMLTQGYTRFLWANLIGKGLEEPMVKADFPAEGLGTSISGTVRSLSNKPLSGASITLMALRAGVTKSTISNAAGKFSFDDIFLTDSVGLAIQGRMGKSNRLEVLIDTLPEVKVPRNKNMADVNTDINGTVGSYIANSRAQDKWYERTGQLTRVQRLNEVNITARKRAIQAEAPQGMFKVPASSADRSIVMEGAEHCATLMICLQSQLPGVRFERSGGTINIVSHRGPLTLILNGRKISTPEEVFDILDGGLLAEDVLRVDVVYTNMALISFLGSPSLLIITKNGALFRKQNNPSIVNISPKGFNKVKEFYNPRYSRASNNLIPDFRSTVYWNPNLKTYSIGKTSFSYYNADGPGVYKVIVEGINSDGQIGRQEYRYEVKGEPVSANSAAQAVGTVDVAVNGVSQALDSLRKRLPIEKVYLHTDKSYYNIGDTLWFKGYLMDGANLKASNQSGLLYVELYNDSSEIIRRISIPIKKGLGWAQIPLDEKIFREGGYTLRSYTNWMQNFGEAYFFTKRFYLGVARAENWLVTSAAQIVKLDNKDQLQVELKLKRNDGSPAGLRDMEVRIYDRNRYLYKEKLQTSLDGTLKLSHVLPQRAEGRSIRLTIMTLAKSDGNQVLNIPLDVNRSQHIDLQFLPEGGQLVAGLPSLIGFKAIAENGKGIAVSGTVFDSRNMQVVKFETFHKGMGSFEFTPKDGESYTAKLDGLFDAVKTYALPKIQATGTVLHVINERQSDAIEVKVSTNSELADQYDLIGTSKGKLYYGKRLEGNQSISVPKNLFPSGIVTFTLLKNKKAWNERKVFIDQGDRLSVVLKANKELYLKRDSVELDIEVKDDNGMPVKGSFSLAVTDDNQVKPDSLGDGGIEAGLLLRSELKGEIEEPGYYLRGGNDASWKALDQLMLTQGWTGYSWEQVFSPPVAPKFLPEQGFKITGLVTNLLNKPVAYAPVLISSQKPSFIQSVSTDINGRYVFDRLPNIDSGSFFLQARTPKGKRKSTGELTVERFKAPQIPSILSYPILPWYVNGDETQVNYAKQMAQRKIQRSPYQDGISLDEVKIGAAKVIKGSMNPYGDGASDLAFDEQDIKKSGVMNLYQLLRQKIPGFRIYRNYEFFSGGVVAGFGKYIVTLRTDIGIDGKTLPLIINPTTTPQDIIEQMEEDYVIQNLKGLEVMYSRKLTDRTGPRIYDWARIEITTANGRGWYKQLEPDVATYRPLPLLHPAMFYSPKYNVEHPTSVDSDYRSTIFWEPDVTTDLNGKARMRFYTSDASGSYTIKLEGSDMEGRIGSFTRTIKVKE